MLKDKLNHIGANLLPAIAYGDSLGLPVETLRPEDIVRRYGRIECLMAINNPYLGRAAAGSWSDDTRLSLAVSEAITDSCGLDMDSVVSRHIAAMSEEVYIQHGNERIPRGWGKSTYQSVERLITDPLGWKSSGSETGQGNGVLMKLAPLAIWQTAFPSVNGDSKYNDSFLNDFVRMTHNNDLSVVTALTHREVLKGLLLETLDIRNLLEFAADSARKYELVYSQAGRITSSLLSSLASEKRVTPREIHKHAKGGGFHSPETLVMAYGSYVASRLSSSTFTETVADAVNLGGDADSIGSIVGAMTVIDRGFIDLPDDMRFIASLDNLVDAGKRLVNAMRTRAFITTGGSA